MKQTPSVISAGESTTDTLRREALTDAVADGRSARVAVVIPCFRVAEQIESVLRRIGPEVTAVYIHRTLLAASFGQTPAFTC
jgi:hypothetical protein